MIQSFADLTSYQRQLLDRLAAAGLDGSEQDISTRDLPVELMIGSTALVTSKLIEIGLDQDGAATFRITEHGRRIRLGDTLR